MELGKIPQERQMRLAPIDDILVVIATRRVLKKSVCKAAGV